MSYVMDDGQRETLLENIAALEKTMRQLECLLSDGPAIWMCEGPKGERDFYTVMSPSRIDIVKSWGWTVKPLYYIPAPEPKP